MLCGIIRRSHEDHYSLISEVHVCLLGPGRDRARRDNGSLMSAFTQAEVVIPRVLLVSITALGIPNVTSSHRMRFAHVRPALPHDAHMADML